MSDHLKVNAAIDAADVELEHEPVAAGDVVEGTPTTGLLTLVESDDLEIGVWEITPGVVTDTEAAETFVVLSGAATVEFLDGGEPLTLRAGTVGRLAEGARTRWTVTETLRKVYVTPA